LRIVYYNRLLNEPWGCGVHGRALVHSWRRLGHEVLCLPDDLVPDDERPSESRIGRHRWLPDVLRVPMLDLRARARVVFTTGRLLRQVDRFRPDVLIGRRSAYDYVLDELVRGTLVPHVIAEVNAIIHWELSETMGETIPPWEVARELAFLRKANTAVAVSAGVAEQLRSLGLQPESVAIVPNGTDVSRFDPQCAPDEEVAAWASTKNAVVVFCGTLAAHQDMETIAQAVGHLGARSGIGFLFVGPTREQLAGLFGDWPAPLVYCTGRIAHDRVPSVLACADVAWAALANDRVSALKLFEYMAMALPVALADERQGGRLVEEAQCGLAVRRGDSLGLARSVELILSRPELASSMGLAGRSWVEEHADWDRVAERMLSRVSGATGRGARAIV